MEKCRDRLFWFARVVLTAKLVLPRGCLARDGQNRRRWVSLGSIYGIERRNDVDGVEAGEKVLSLE